MIKYIIAIFISAVISYLLGSCNSSIITVKLLKGEDIRKFGSGNAGLSYPFHQSFAGICLRLSAIS